MAKGILNWFSEDSQLSKMRKQIVVQEQKLLAQFPMPILLVNSKGQILFANKLAVDILHKSPEELRTLFTKDFGLNEGDFNTLTVKSPAKSFGLVLDNHIALKATISKWKRSLFLMVLSIHSEMAEATKMEETSSVVYKTVFSSESRDFTQKVVDTIPIALSVKNAKGEYVLWNKKSEELFGATSAEVIGKLDYRLNATAEQTDFFQQTEKSIFEQKVPQDTPRELVSTPSGDIRILHTTKTPIFSEEGKPQYLVTFSSDVTDQNRLERQIKETDDQKLLLLDSLPEGIVLIEEGKVVYANNSFYELLGYADYQAVLNRDFDTFVTQEYKMAFANEYQQLVDKGLDSSKKVSLQLQGPDGQRNEVFLSLKRVAYSGNNVVLGYVQYTAISTEGKTDNSVVAVAPVGADNSSIFLPNNEPYLVCDENLTILNCNDCFCSLIKDTKENILSRGLKDLLAADSVAEFEQDALVLQETEVLNNKEYKLKTKDSNEVCQVKLSASKVGDLFLFVLHSMAFHIQIMKILDERSSQLSALLEATDGIVFSVSFENGKFGKLERANKGFSKELGYLHEEMEKMTLEDLLVDSTQKKQSSAKVLAEAQKSIVNNGKVFLKLGVRRKNKPIFQANIAMSLLNTAHQESVLVVVQDLTAQLKKLAINSPEAQELQTVRCALPGLYIKMNSQNTIDEISSNLPHFTQENCLKLVGKSLNLLWNSEIEKRALATAKEAMAIGVNSEFEFNWKINDTLTTYRVLVMPIANQQEFVLWVNDLSEAEQQFQQMHSLYQLTSAQGLTLTERVDKLLDFGCKLFQTELGVVLRLEEAAGGYSTSVIYATKNNLHLEQRMEFPLEECFAPVLDGNVVVSTNLSESNCTHCIHKNKGFISMVAAPVYVENEVQGILCFASTTSRNEFPKGTEELMGVMAQFLGLRIELRQVNKIVGHATKALARSMEHLEMPAVMLDANFRIMQINDPLVILTGKNYQKILGRDFFKELIHITSEAKKNFISTAKSASSTFQMLFSTRVENGAYEEIVWNVFVCNNDDGERESYVLLAHFY